MQNILKGSFGKAILTLISGSLLAQGFTIIVAPLLTRIYTPEQLGIYTLILTAETLFGAIICARYDISIVSEKKSENVFPLIKLSIMCTIFLSFLAAMLYGTYYFILQEQYRIYWYAIILIFIMLAFNGVIRILDAYNNRAGHYKVMTSVFVIRSAIQNFGAVGLGFLKLGVLGLLISHITAMLFGINRQLGSLKNNIKSIFDIPIKNIKVIAKENYRQPLYSTPAIFANRFSYSSILLFIEALYGLATLGYYFIANKVLGLPLSVLSTNVAKVFFKDASNEYNETGKFINTFKKTSILLTILAIPLVIILFFLSPIIFKYIFGPSWEKAGIYVQILAPMFGIRLIVNTIAYGLQIVGKQKYELILQILFIIASIFCFFISKTLDLNVYGYLISVSITFSLIYIIYYIEVYKFAKGKLSNN